MSFNFLKAICTKNCFTQMIFFSRVPENTTLVPTTINKPIYELETVYVRFPLYMSSFDGGIWSIENVYIYNIAMQ